MPEHLNPCTRCNGSGTEPDPITQAFEAMVREVNSITSDPNSRGWAMERFRGACAARILFLETALRDILGHLLPANAMLGDSQILQVRNEDVANWRKVLGDDPETRAGWSFDHELGGKA